MNNIELIVNKNDNNDIDCNDINFSTSQDTDNELNMNTNSTLDFSMLERIHLLLLNLPCLYL